MSVLSAVECLVEWSLLYAPWTVPIALTNAYGISVAGAMITTTVLFVAVRSRRIHLHAGFALVVLAAGLFLPLDPAFVVANLGKVVDGGAVPLCRCATKLACRCW